MTCGFFLAVRYLPTFVCAVAIYLAGGCSYFCVLHAIAGSTQEYIPLQAGPSATIEYVEILGECCPDSLYLVVLVFVSGATSLSHVDVAFNVLHLNEVDIYWCVVSQHHLCLPLDHLQSLIYFHFHQLVPVEFVVVHLVY